MMRTNSRTTNRPKVMPKKIGRPLLPKAERKAETLTFRLTMAERKAADAAAKRRGVAISEWVRFTIASALRSKS